MILFFLREAFCGLCRKCVCGRGFAPDPSRGAHEASRPPWSAGEGHSFQANPLGAFGVSTLAPPALGSAPRTDNFWLRHCIRAHVCMYCKEWREPWVLTATVRITSYYWHIISWPDGTVLRNWWCSVTTTQLALTCGRLAASLLKCWHAVLFFLVCETISRGFVLNLAARNSTEWKYSRWMPL